MKTVLLCFLLLQVVFSTRDWYTESPLLELNSDNFNDYVGTEKYVIVEFYTKECKYCKVIVPEVEKLNDYIKQNNLSNVVLARIEGHKYNDIASSYQITRYPKIVMFYPHSDEINSTFKEKRTFDNFKQWLIENTKK